MIEDLLKSTAVEELRDWFRRRSRRTRLLLILAVAAAVFGIIERDRLFAATVTWFRYAHVLYHHDSLQLSHRRVRELDKAIDALSRSVAADLLQKPRVAQAPFPSNSMDAWSFSQAVVALERTQYVGIARLGQDSITSYLTATRQKACGCWHEWPYEAASPSHVIATAWAVFAMARHSISCEIPELRFLLECQLDNGGWSVFPTNSAQTPYASSLSTGMVLLALHEQREAGLVPSELRPNVDKAILAGVAWIRSNWRSDIGGLPLYPGTDARERSVCASALCMHVLVHLEGADLVARQREWLQHLPPAGVRPGAWDAWNDHVPYGDPVVMRKESVRCLTAPWLLIATVDAYPAGSLAERESAQRLVEAICDSLPQVQTESGTRVFVKAEWLIALRHLRNLNLIRPRVGAIDRPTA